MTAGPSRRRLSGPGGAAFSLNGTNAAKNTTATFSQAGAYTLTVTISDGSKSVPSLLLTPVAVTKSQIKGTIVKDNFFTVSQICTAQYAAVCKSAGLT